TGSRFAAAGAETACWDLLAQSRRVSLAGLLGATADRVESWVESGLAVGLYPTVVELLQAIEPHLDEGYERVKIKICPGQDVELVRAVRRHFAAFPPRAAPTPPTPRPAPTASRNPARSGPLCSKSPLP